MSSVGGASVVINWTGASGTVPASVTAFDGRAVTYGFDSFGYLDTATQPGPTVWNYVNDGAGRILEKLDPAGIAVATNTYDDVGRVETQESSTSAETHFDYEPATRSVVVTNLATSTSVTYVYDENGRMVSIEDPLGEVASRSYDEHDLLTGAQTRGGGSTAINRNGSGLPESVTSPGETATTVTYLPDGSNRVAAATTPSTGTTTYTYTGSGTDSIDGHRR
ncbi:MAG: RHS repeat protein [Microthrixaceae bacterium]|nr:RHS repeat protein [Microthrixaceae bacterium]